MLKDRTAKHVVMPFQAFITETSQNQRCVRRGRAALLCMQMIALMSPTFPAMASDNQRILPPSYQLPNGHTIGELGGIIKAGFGLRDALTPSVASEQNPNKSKLQQFLALPIPEKSAEGLIQFFMRGATPFPCLTTKGNFIVFFNPIVDAGIITSWGGATEAPILTGATLVSGEYLTSSAVADPAPRWQLEEKMADKIVELNREVQNEATRADSGFVKSMTDALAHPIKDDALKTVLKRIAIAGIGTVDAALPCGKEISRAATSLASLRDAATRTNTPKDS